MNKEIKDEKPTRIKRTVAVEQKGKFGLSGGRDYWFHEDIMDRTIEEQSKFNQKINEFYQKKD